MPRNDWRLDRAGKVAPYEDREQESVITEIDLLARGKHSDLARVFAVPNGALRHPAVAALLKAQGVRPGVPDLLFLKSFCTCGNPNGIVVEQKAGDNTTSDEQDRWLAWFAAQHFVTRVATSAVETVALLKRYDLGRLSL